jgi:hypothetical protein
MGKIKKFSEYEPLSDDIQKVIVDDYDKVKGDYEIESILDVISDPEQIEKIDNTYKKNEANTLGVNTDLSIKDVKRGGIVYITCLLRRKNTTSFNSQAVQGVLKLRIVDIYYGLQYLNKVINQ